MSAITILPAIGGSATPAAHSAPSASTDLIGATGVDAATATDLATKKHVTFGELLGKVVDSRQGGIADTKPPQSLAAEPTANGPLVADAPTELAKSVTAVRVDVEPTTLLTPGTEPGVALLQPDGAVPQFALALGNEPRVPTVITEPVSDSTAEVANLDASAEAPTVNDSQLVSEIAHDRSDEFIPAGDDREHLVEGLLESEALSPLLPVDQPAIVESDTPIRQANRESIRTTAALTTAAPIVATTIEAARAVEKTDTSIPVEDHPVTPSLLGQPVNVPIIEPQTQVQSERQSTPASLSSGGNGPSVALRNELPRAPAEAIRLPRTDVGNSATQVSAIDNGNENAPFASKQGNEQANISTDSSPPPAPQQGGIPFTREPAETDAIRNDDLPSSNVNRPVPNETGTFHASSRTANELPVQGRLANPIRRELAASFNSAPKASIETPAISETYVVPSRSSIVSEPGDLPGFSVTTTRRELQTESRIISSAQANVVSQRTPVVASEIGFETIAVPSPNPPRGSNSPEPNQPSFIPAETSPAAGVLLGNVSDSEPAEGEIVEFELLNASVPKRSFRMGSTELVQQTVDRPTSTDAPMLPVVIAPSAEPLANPPLSARRGDSFSVSEWGSAPLAVAEPAQPLASSAAEPTLVSDVPGSPSAAKQVVSQIVTEAAWVPESGEGEFRLRLDPPHLGEVRVRIVKSKAGLKAEITALSETTETLLAGKVEQLESSLRQAGVDVAEITVDQSLADESSGNLFADQQDQREPQSRRLANADYPTHDPTESETTTAGEPDRRLDLTL